MAFPCYRLQTFTKLIAAAQVPTGSLITHKTSPVLPAPARTRSVRSTRARDTCRHYSDRNRPRSVLVFRVGGFIDDFIEGREGC